MTSLIPSRLDSGKFLLLQHRSISTKRNHSKCVTVFQLKLVKLAFFNKMFNVIQRSLKKNCINAWLVYNLLSNRPVSYLAFGYFKSDTLNSILKSAHFKNKNCSNINKNILIREIHTSNVSNAKKKKNEIYDNSLVLIREFENVEKKNKTAFLDMVS